MKLIKFGKKGLLSKVNAIICFVWKNCKLELLIIVLGFLWINSAWRVPVLRQLITAYFTDSRCSGIASFASVIIGIYVTVWSIFATSASKINAELLKRKVEGQLFFLIGVDLAEAFMVTALCIFIPRGIPYYTEMMILFTTLTFASFVKFIILVMMITKLNIKYIAQEIDEHSTQCTEAQVKLDEIYQRTLDGEK